MISYLTGTVIHKDDKYLILDVQGVGYKLFTTIPLFESALLDKTLSLWTHLAVREDSMTLYGFHTKEELAFFELLISISGIGPKTALGVLNVSSLPALRKAVASGDTSHLTKVSGIGRKIADKIVLELRGKFVDEGENEITLRDEVDALEALKSLGYSPLEAREALKQVPKDITSTSARVKHALKSLGK